MKYARFGIVQTMALAGAMAAAAACSSGSDSGTPANGGAPAAGAPAAGAPAAGAPAAGAPAAGAPAGGAPAAGASSGGASGAGSGGTSAGGASSGSGGTSAGSGGTSGSVGTGGISGTKTVGMLSSAEIAQLCTDAYARYAAKIPKATTCKWDALDFASSTSAQSDDMLRNYCTMQETTCTGKADPWADHPDCSDPPMGCSVTVDEYFKCIDDMVMPFTQTVTSLPMCSALKTSDTAAIITAKAGGTPPASCSALTTKCQDLTIPGPIN